MSPFEDGEVILRNLELNLATLEHVFPHIHFNLGEVRELQLVIPWTSIYSTPISLTLHDVVLEAETIMVSNDITIQFISTTNNNADLQLRIMIMKVRVIIMTISTFLQRVR